ncbi:MAG: DNA mismatch repair protein MutS, partial [bacterium]|nr:DNA mismatch repair protein MutS [bacterium]
MMMFTPMIQQYLELKSKHIDSILFFRLGDFYEMFFEDAKIAAKILGITLTSRDGGSSGKVPMCGVPHHAAEGYISMLILAGKKVAICEQVDKPSGNKGLMNREIVRVITPSIGLQSEPDQLNYIISIATAAEEWTMVAIEFSTGSVTMYPANGERAPEVLAEEILKISPKEAICEQNLPAQIMKVLLHIECLCHSPLGLNVVEAKKMSGEFLKEVATPSQYLALGEAIHYLNVAKAGSLHLFAPIEVRIPGSVMGLDSVTRRNLELTKSWRHSDKAGSLLWVLDHTCTAMG